MKTIKQLKKFSRKMRSNITKEELYVLIQLGKLGIPFNYQKILGFYILDFVLPIKMVNIEVDGLIHKERKVYDYLRDKFVKECGLSIIRIKNEDIFDYNYDALLTLPDYEEKKFRSAVGYANAIRSNAIIKARKNGECI